MSNRNATLGAARAPLVIGLLAGAAVAGTLGLVLRQYGPGNMGNGMLIGGAAMLALIAVAAWRARTRPDRAGAIDRHFGGTADERDDAILTGALAVVGLIAVPLTGLAAVAMALGVRTDMAMALLLFVELAVLVVSYVGASKRA